MEKGQWVFFQNCHLSPSWMPTLERLVEQVDPDHVRLIFHDFLIYLLLYNLLFDLSTER
jgi:dynein heavy chain